MDERRGGREGDGEALLAGGQAESQGGVRLARAGIAQRDHVLPAEDELAPRQFQL
jgi:hypothetical protein